MQNICIFVLSLQKMKRLVLYILFVLAAVCFSDTAQGNNGTYPDAFKAELSSEKQESASLWEFIASNDAADISLQQHNPFSQNNTLRRNLQIRILQAKLLFYLSEDLRSFSVEAFRTSLSLYRNYFAQQKMCGYYIYGLCKIII